jgi:PAS domain S-box-containing protein
MTGNFHVNGTAILCRRTITLLLVVLGACLILLVQPALSTIPSADRPKIIVGGDRDNPPYEFLVDGNPTGFNIELMRAVADVAGFDVEFRLGPWDGVRKELEQGKIDAVAGMYFSPERSGLVEFSVPHTMVTSGIFVRKGSPVRSFGDIKGKEIIVQKGDVIDDFLRQNRITSHIVSVTDPADALRLLASGKHDCALMPSMFQGEYIIRKLSLSNVRGVNADLPQLRYCFAVGKGNSGLRYRLDEGLNILRVTGRYQKIYEKWFGVYEKRDLWHTLRYFVLALVLVATLCLVFLIWSWMLKRRVEQRTAELRESEELFRVLAATTPAAIIFYQGEKHVYVNPYATRLTGYTEREFLEMSFWEWMHEDCKEQVRQYGLARQRGEQVPVQYEAKCVTKSGKEKWIYISAGRIEYRGAPAGIMSIFDITVRKRAEESLRTINEELERRVTARTSELAVLNEDLTREIATRRQVEEELRHNKDKVQAIVDNFDGMIYICSKDNRIEFMNKGFLDRTGCNSPGEYCYKALHGRDSICPGCDLGSVFEGKTVRRELQASGDGHWDYVVDVPLYHADGSISRQTIVTDITERKLAEELIMQKQQQLEQLNNTLERRVREELLKNREKDFILIQQNRQAALGELLDHIAHQWKQPLNAISLLTNDLKENCLDSELPRGHICDTADVIVTLVQDIAQMLSVFRDFYKPDKEMTRFLVKESIEKALSFVEPALRFDSVEIDLDADPELSVLGYPKEYAQVILNILSNARDVFKERKVGKPRVKICAFAEGERAVVTISDNGGGIPEIIIGKIFNLYFTTKESYGGTGIGLHMSKNIIEKNMGGELSVANIGSGAQFRIELTSAGC